MKPLQSRGSGALLLLPHTHTHTKVKRTLSKLRHTQTILLHELILYISWYVWYCGVHVVSCYDAVLGGAGYLWTLGWDRGGSVSVRLSPPLSLFYLFVFLWGETFPLLLCLVWLVTEKLENKMQICWNWSQAHSWLFFVRAVVWIQILSCCDNSTCV